MSQEDNQSLKSLVGAKTYKVWVDMVQSLVPHGRTHRLAPLVAGMLHHALAQQFLDHAQLNTTQIYLKQLSGESHRHWQAMTNELELD